MTKVCILTAGKGSRLNKYSQIINKSILPLNEKAIISHIFELFNPNDEFIIGLGYRGADVKDYIKIAQKCNFIIIENIPNFNNDNSNQQQRFVTLIDILYEKSIPLMITSQSRLDLLSSSKNLKQFFKRTVSRLYELTSIKYSYL